MKRAATNRSANEIPLAAPYETSSQILPNELFRRITIPLSWSLCPSDDFTRRVDEECRRRASNTILLRDLILRVEYNRIRDLVGLHKLLQLFWLHTGI